jgi:hypothetical protein
MLKVDLNNHNLTDNDGKEHELSSNEFWCIVPIIYMNLKVLY